MTVRGNVRGLAWCWMIVFGAASPAWCATADESGLCELKIDGHSIVSLTLIQQRDPSAGQYAGLSGKQYDRPGKSLWLPAGRYRIENVQVEGSFESGERFGHQDQWFELTPGVTHQLVCGAPLAPRVTVKRHGKFLEMDCDLVNRAGRSYVSRREFDQQLPPPRFSVYKYDELLGTESFAYG